MAAEASRVPQEGAKGDGATQARSALLIDWGGVLTTNLFESFTAHCERIGIELNNCIYRRTLLVERLNSVQVLLHKRMDFVLARYNAGLQVSDAHLC